MPKKITIKKTKTTRSTRTFKRRNEAGKLVKVTVRKTHRLTTRKPKEAAA